MRLLFKSGVYSRAASNRSYTVGLPPRMSVDADTSPATLEVSKAEILGASIEEPLEGTEVNGEVLQNDREKDSGCDVS